MMFYHWITLSSMIILLLFIRRNLRIKILQMLQNGLIILTIWSLMRMVNLSHDSYDKCDDFDFLIVNFPYLSSNIPESPAYGVFCLTVNTLRSGWFKIWRFSVQTIYSGFKVIETGIVLTDYISEILWSLYRLCSQIWHLCATYV